MKRHLKIASLVALFACAVPLSSHAWSLTAIPAEASAKAVVRVGCYGGGDCSPYPWRSYYRGGGYYGGPSYGGYGSGGYNGGYGYRGYNSYGGYEGAGYCGGGYCRGGGGYPSGYYP